MGLSRHWTIRYLFYRLANLLYQKAHPDRPWLTPAAIRELETRLNKKQVGLEFGSGRSTLWIARRVGHLTSVEHKPDWVEKVQRMLNKGGINNVDYHFAPHPPEEKKAGGSPPYVQLLEKFPKTSLDFVLVDGPYRDLCILSAIPRLKPGGMLILDNANRYLPSLSRAPHSRTLRQGPDGKSWQQIARLFKEWPCSWTTNGVFDTAIFTKPGHQVFYLPHG